MLENKQTFVHTMSLSKRQKMLPTNANGSNEAANANTVNYKEIDIIGKGAYGTVYLARNNMNSELVAIKKMRVPLTENGVPMSTLREIALLKQLNACNHDNIVKLIEVCQFLESDSHLLLMLVFELLEQDLSDLIASQPSTGMPVCTIKRLSKELLMGVDFLHSHRIVHRDLKPQNLLISSQGHLKIADFGLAKTYDSQMKLTSVVVTLWYRAPEVLLSQPYNSTVDIWSVACIMAEMFTRKPLFPGTSDMSQLECIFKLIGLPSETQWSPNISICRDHFKPHHPRRPRDLCTSIGKLADDLIKQMLSYEISLRPSALECLQHEYFDQEDPL